MVIDIFHYDYYQILTYCRVTGCMLDSCLFLLLIINSFNPNRNRRGRKQIMEFITDFNFSMLMVSVYKIILESNNIN